MAELTVHGPVDFLLMEFSADRITGAAATEVVDLVDRGIIRVYDIAVLTKDEDGRVALLDLLDPEMAAAGDFVELAWARTGLLEAEDVDDAAAALAPGTLAVLLVYENLWAVPFVAAAREAGGELVAGTRIPAQAVMEALDRLDKLDEAGPVEQPVAQATN